MIKSWPVANLIVFFFKTKLLFTQYKIIRKRIKKVSQQLTSTCAI